MRVNQVAEAAAAGFKTIIGIRPDREGDSEQPSSKEIRQAAEANGLQYVHITLVPGQLTYAKLDELGELLSSLSPLSCGSASLGPAQ